MQRLYDFFRRHPTWVDSFWAVVLLGVSGMSLVAGQQDMQGDARLLGVPVVLALSLAVALRRRVPERMLILIAVVGVFQLVANVRVQPADFAMLVIIYTVAADSPAGRPDSRSSEACARRRSRSCAGRCTRRAARATC